MKSSVAVALIALQVLTLCTVIYFESETRRSTKASIDRLEQIKDSLSGSLSRQSELVLRLKNMTEDLDRRADHEAAQALMGQQPPATGSDDHTTMTADHHLRKLIEVFRDLENAKQSGTETASMNALFKATEDDFVARGPQSLVLLPEELRANRDENVRRYLLEQLLNRFASLDPKGCFQASRKILLDAAGTVGLRKLAARQALQFDRNAALIDIRDLLGKSGATSVELRVELLDVLRDYPDPELEVAICRLAENPSIGPRIQTAAIRLLAAYGTPAAIESLKRLIDSGTPNAQTEAIQAIASIMKQDAIPYLEEIAARDPKTVPDVVRGKAKYLADELKSGKTGSG